MVFLNVSVCRGPRTLSFDKLLNFAPELTIHEVSDSVLREDAQQLAHVEARQRVESTQTTYDAASEEEMLEMLVWCVVVDSAIPKTAAGLHMSSADLKKGHPDLKAWVQLHTDCSEYQVSMGNTVIWPS